MKRILLTTLSLLILTTGMLLAGTTATGHDIEVKINGLKNAEIFLAYHFGDKQYMKDTAMLDSKGVASFKGNEPLPCGIYLVVLPNKTYFEIMVGNDQEFRVTNDTMDFIKNFKVEGSLDNSVFYEDIRFIGEKQQERKKIEAQINDAGDNEAAKKPLREKLKALDQDVKNHRKNIIKQHPGTLYSSILLMLQDIEVPDAPRTETGELKDSLFEYKYIKAHYFDNISFGDECLLRTPILLQKVDTYLDKWVSPDPDSIIPVVDHILQEALANDETFRFWAITLLNKYANSKIMGQDAVYVHIVEQYYGNGKAYWVETADSLRIVENAKSIKPLLIGKTAPNLVMKDLNGKFHVMHNLQAKYVVLYFYADDCGHCKKETPKLVAAVDSLKNQYNLAVWAVNTQAEYDKWKAFVDEHKMHDFTNLADVEYQNPFREIYNIKSTPQFYLLDKEKKIVAKRLTAEQLPDVLKALEKMEQEKSGSKLNDSVIFEK